jgi:hypothetical protein
MRRVAAVVLVMVLTLTVVVPPVEACGECVALGLASFVVFTSLVSALATPRVVYATPAYYASAYYPPYGYRAGYGPAGPYAVAPYPTAYYPTYRAVYPYAAATAPVAWTGSRVVQYAHGRHELRGDGVSVPYSWVWIPSVPAPAPAPSQDGPEGSGARTH